MSAEVSREMLRQALIDQIPDCRVVAGRICLAAMRRAGAEVEYGGDTCYFASETFSTNCFGEVNADGTSVTGSYAEGGGCLREVQVDANLADFERISPIE